MKRLIRDNVTMTGKLDTVKFSRALLQYRNTKDRDTTLANPLQSFCWVEPCVTSSPDLKSN